MQTQPETIPGTSDDTREITNLLTDAIESAYGIGLNLNEVIVLACEGWCEHHSGNVIDTGLARILAHISAEHVRTDLDAREAARQPRRRARKPREAMLSPRPPLSPDNRAEQEATL